MTESTKYIGIDKDKNNGLTHYGRIVRDAWVFGILPESETCAGWGHSQMQKLYEQIHTAWEPYGHMPSRLPDALQKKHMQIYSQAIEKAKQEGWNPELGEDD